MKKIALIFSVVFSLFLGRTNVYAQVGVRIEVAPPELLVYDQPACPVDGYIWTPGYWAYGSDGYYWVAGIWVLPAQPGFLWTPGYWGFEGGFYGWNRGYWGQSVGFYGGVCYGYGYSGIGYGGGRWDGGHFRYNTAVSNVNRSVVHNTYEDRTAVNNNSNRTSFNGKGGIAARPNANEQTAMKQNHIHATSSQQSHQQAAGKNRNSPASANGGHPVAHTANSAAAQHPANATHANVPQQHLITSHQQAPRTQQHQAVAHQQAPRAQQQHQVVHQQAPRMEQQHAAPAQQREAAPAEHGGGGGERR